MKEKTLDLRRVTKKNLETNITGRTESGAYFANINGVEVLFEYHKNLDNLFYPVCSKGNPDCDRIYVYVESGEYGECGIFDSLVKVVKF